MGCDSGIDLIKHTKNKPTESSPVGCGKSEGVMHEIRHPKAKSSAFAIWVTPLAEKACNKVDVGRRNTSQDGMYSHPRRVVY